MNQNVKKIRMKVVLLMISAVVMVFSVVQGSSAWLMTQTDPIVNVFTYGDIQIVLDETTGDRYKMTPGKWIDKDPKLTLKAQSEDCWLFVKIDESENAKLSDYIKYEVADGWIPLEGTENVYYRSVDYADEDISFNILKDDRVKVKNNVTKQMLEQLSEETFPRLTFTGYAVQRDADIEEIDTPEEAWALIEQ